MDRPDDDSLDIAAFSQEEVQAIIDLDFERAFCLCRQKARNEARAVESETARYRAEAARLARQIAHVYQNDIHQIATECAINSTRCRARWHCLSTSLAARQRREAAALEAKWRSARNAALERRSQLAVSQQTTAALLTMCGRFDVATASRESAERRQAEDQSLLGREFGARYGQMIARHRKEWRDLAAQLDTIIAALGRRADAQQSTARAVARQHDALNAAEIIQSVAAHPVSPKARDAVIRQFSPRATTGSRSPGSRTSARSEHES
jgi:hypothetical protein